MPSQKKEPTLALNIRIKTSEKEALQRLADADGRSVSNYIEHYILRPYFEAQK